MFTFVPFFRRPTWFAAPLFALLLIGGSCIDDESSESDFPTVDTQFDGESFDSSPTPDTAVDANQPDSDASDVSSRLQPVAIDIDEYVHSRSPESSAARAYRMDSDAKRPPGPVSRARKGDYVLENDRIRVFVERFDESVSPCPYGGNIVDGVYKAPDGSLHGDLVGEVCPQLNVGLTMKPRRFELLRDGRQRGTAVLSVTGDVVRLDFLNLRAMAPGDVQDIIENVPFDPSRKLPLTITVYYILEHGDSSVQVVTALRNDGQRRVDALFGHLVKSGGHGAFFNPLNQLGGFGYKGLSRSNIEGNPIPYIGYRGPDASYAYMPTHRERLRAALPSGGVQVTTSGVSGAVLGIDTLPSVLLSTEESFREKEGVLHLQPGESQTYVHRFFLGDGELASVADPIYERMPLETGRVNGALRNDEGSPVAGARISAVDDDGRTINQAVTDEGGLFTFEVPPGSYELRALWNGRSKRFQNRLDVEPGETRGRQLRVERPGVLDVRVVDHASSSVPARVSVRCVDGCNERPSSQLTDVTTDSLPSGFQAVEPTAPDGTAQIELPPGAYRVYVSRGLEWSVWPADAPSSGGTQVQISSGEQTSLQAEIARVVDTSGATGGDYHVHGVRSADSVVTRRDRVMSFVSEGVEVLVSTDHDVVTDYQPFIEELGVDDAIVGIRGDEITTSDIGHFNGFPIPQDSSHRAGGALDWGRGTEPNMTPAQIYSWVHDHPGPQVVQVNHPAGSLGLINNLDADVLHGTTHADSEHFRLPGGEPDPQTGDTGYWSDDFTAIELLNGAHIGNFWAIARWWMTMIGRGFTPTGTAVTDTHELYSHLGGSPRTYVFGGDAIDAPTDFDRDTYVEAVNAGRAIGTNGPFFRVSVRNASGKTAGLGSTVRTQNGRVTVEVDIDMPTWMRVDRVDLFSNVEGVVTEPGEAVRAPLEPTKSIPIEWSASDIEIARRGDRPHRHRTKSLEIPLEVSSDAYIIVVVRADEDRRGGVWPVVPSKSVVPFAFSNPILVDTDGGGYDDPPLADEANSPPMRSMSTTIQDGLPSSEGIEQLDRADLERMMEAFRSPHAPTP